MPPPPTELRSSTRSPEPGPTPQTTQLPQTTRAASASASQAGHPTSSGTSAGRPRAPGPSRVRALRLSPTANSPHPPPNNPSTGSAMGGSSFLLGLLVKTGSGPESVSLRHLRQRLLGVIALRGDHPKHWAAGLCRHQHFRCSHANPHQDRPCRGWARLSDPKLAAAFPVTTSPTNPRLAWRGGVWHFLRVEAPCVPSPPFRRSG